MDTFFPIQKTGQIKALVLGGGGAKGSYEAGVVQALSDLGFQYDLLTGTSIGAICGSLYIQESPQKIEEWISSFHQNDVAKNLFLFPNQYTVQQKPDLSFDAFMQEYTKGGPSIQPLIEKLGEVFDYEAFMKSPVDYACLSFNLSKNKAQPYFKKDMTEADALNKILSSTAYFPAFNAIEIDGDFIVDGGYAQTVPVDLAREMGAQQILAVDLSQPGVASQIEENENQKVIRPLLQLKYYLDFEAPDLMKQVKEGYLETLKYFNKAPGYLYTFYEEDWEHMLHLEEACMAVLDKFNKVYLIEKLPEVLNEVYQFLLGYVPQPLNNAYAGPYIFGRILEVMGLIAGVDPYQQYHFRDFFHMILEKFLDFTSNPNLVAQPARYNEMEIKGLRDLIVFFRTALLSYDNKLPEGFDGIIRKFELPYYLAYGWILLEKYRLLVYL